MRLREAVACGGDAEIAILRVGAQTVGLEVFLAVMADGDALLGTRGFFGATSRAFAFTVLRAVIVLRLWLRSASSPRLAMRCAILLSWPWLPPLLLWVEASTECEIVGWVSAKA